MKRREVIVIYLLIFVNLNIYTSITIIPNCPSVALYAIQLHLIPILSTPFNPNSSTSSWGGGVLPSPPPLHKNFYRENVCNSNR